MKDRVQLGVGRGTSILPTECGAWCGARCHDPEIMTWAKIKRWMFNQLSPQVPWYSTLLNFRKYYFLLFSSIFISYSYDLISLSRIIKHLQMTYLWIVVMCSSSKHTSFLLCMLHSFNLLCFCACFYIKYKIMCFIRFV